MLKLSIVWSCLWLRSADVKNNEEELRDIKYCNIYLYPINWRIFFQTKWLIFAYGFIKINVWLFRHDIVHCSFDSKLEKNHQKTKDYKSYAFE